MDERFAKLTDRKHTNRKLTGEQQAQNQKNKEKEAVFDSPWQAKTFAMAVKLNEANVFSWSEWADEFSQQIAEHEKHSVIETSDDYYCLWQSALEQLVERKTKAILPGSPPKQ